jgi:hypothetical protein
VAEVVQNRFKLISGNVGKELQLGCDLLMLTLAGQGFKKNPLRVLQ